MATRTQVIAEARSWMGTRFHHQARVKGVGVDCINLVIAVATELQLIAPDFVWESYPEYQGYGLSPNEPLLLAGCERFLVRISLKEVRPADILILKFATEAQHFALVTQTEPTYIIHAYAQVRRVTEHGFDALWQSRLVACYRFKNLED